MNTTHSTNMAMLLPRLMRRCGRRWGDSGHPHDLADRFIIATALAGNLPLMTADQKTLDWDANVERLSAGQ